MRILFIIWESAWYTVFIDVELNGIYLDYFLAFSFITANLFIAFFFMFMYFFIAFFSISLYK